VKYFIVRLSTCCRIIILYVIISCAPTVF